MINSISKKYFVDGKAKTTYLLEFIGVKVI